MPLLPRLPLEPLLPVVQYPTTCCPVLSCPLLLGSASYCDDSHAHAFHLLAEGVRGYMTAIYRRASEVNRTSLSWYPTPGPSWTAVERDAYPGHTQAVGKESPIDAGPLQRGRQIDLGRYLGCWAISSGSPLAARAARLRTVCVLDCVLVRCM